MADNFSFTPGSGATAASDDISGVHYPRMKLVAGADGVSGGDTTTANPYPVGVCAIAGAGFTTARVLSAASTNATLIKGSAATLGMLQASNTNAAFRYVKVYNKATAPTVGTDTPALTFAVPPGVSVSFSFGAVGLKFDTGLGLAITTGPEDSNTGAVAANELVVNIGFI